MVAAITQQKQETICCPSTENIVIYDRLENIIKKAKSAFKTPDKSYTLEKFNKKAIAHQVQEQKDKAISRSLLMFGTIHR